MRGVRGDEGEDYGGEGQGVGEVADWQDSVACKLQVCDAEEGQGFVGKEDK